MTGAGLVAAARGCLGTRFHHQGRTPGVGLDCIGLVVVALRAAGLPVMDRTDYGRLPEGRALHEALLAHGARAVEGMQAGDVLLLAFRGEAQHVAFCTGEGMMIHAYAGAGRVVETRLGAVWARRVVGVYRFCE